jgi:hypothetical protein
MNVGEYVRTRDGIAKIEKIRNGVIILDVELDLTAEGFGNQYLKEDIIKSSPNIIDLIEVGDYVNGKKVIDVYSDYIFDYSEEFKVIRFSETDILHNFKNIETVLTHEQMEAMQYRVEE